MLSLQEILAKEEIAFSDRKGTGHVLCPLTMFDLLEANKKYGDLGDGLLNSGLEGMIFFIWLSARKEGLNEREIEEEKWKYTLKQVVSWFTAKDIKKVNEIFISLAVMSGLVPKEIGEKILSGDLTDPLVNQTASPESPISP